MEFSGDIDVLVLVGIIILGAYFLGQVFRVVGIPQVVGFIVAGAILGPSFLHVVPAELNDTMEFVTELALGLIGFEMGEHLRFADLRKLGKSILVIVILQAMGAFLLVAGIAYLISGSTPTALIFGALAMATAPAATVDVLAEYGAEGPMTTTLLAVVGIDDALTLLMYSITAALVESMLAGTHVEVIEMLELPFVEIGGSLLVGILFGVFLNQFMDHVHQHHDQEHRQHDAMAVSIALVILCAGLSHMLELSLILTTMVMGITVVNQNPRNGHYIRFTIEQAGPVIYVLFFALVGAGLRIETLPEMGLLGLGYLIMRAIGKYGGTWIGGALSGSSKNVRDYLGLALLSQAGVAIGLALNASHRFEDLGPEGADLAVLVLNVVTATTFVVQLIGPVLVKYAIGKAGEIGKAHEEMRVTDVADAEPGMA